MFKGLKGFILLLGCLVALGPFAAAAENSFESYFVLTGDGGSIAEPNYCLVTNHQDWISLWGRHKGYTAKDNKKVNDTITSIKLKCQIDVPRINFEKCIIVAIFPGIAEEPTCLKIDKIEESSQRINLYYDFDHSVGVEHAKSSPVYGFFAFPKTEKEIHLFQNKSSKNPKVEEKAVLKAASLEVPVKINEKEWVLKEMLIKEEMKSWISLASNRVFFIKFEANQDPPDEFMKRFSGYGVTVKKYSQSNGSVMSGVLDNVTGADGIIIFAFITKRISENKVEVEYGYYMGSEAASWTTQVMEYKNGQWQQDMTVFPIVRQS